MATSNAGCIVELVPAYMWDCPTCGRENFQRAISLIVPNDQLPEHIELEEGEGLIATSTPERVTCRHPDCKATWECRDFRGSEGDEQP